MAGSVTEPISKAAERAQKLLFSPFDLGKWIHVGFIAFIAHLGEGGGYNLRVPNFGGSSPTTSGPSSIASEIDEALRWMRSHYDLLLTFGSIGFVLLLAIGAVVLWVTSRGKLMFFEAVVYDRQEISEPWSRLRELGWSLFKFRLLLALVSWVLFLPLFGAAAFVAWPDFVAFNFGSRALFGILIVLGALFFVAFPLGVVSALLDDFVVPIMGQRSLECVPAWGLFRKELLTGNVGKFGLFYLLTFALGMGMGMIIFVLTMCTCCIAGLPYISSVVFLPLIVFRRAYSLYFMEELGFRIFPDLRPPPSWYEGRFGQ